MPNNIPDEDIDWASNYYINFTPSCGCDDCSRFRDIFDLDVGDNFDPDDYDIDFETGVEGDCDICGSNTPSERISNGGTVCNDCYFEGAIAYCNGCNDFYIVPEDLPWANGVCMGMACPCRDCVRTDEVETFECSNCTEHLPVERCDATEVHTENGVRVVCRSCLDEDFFECGDCGFFRHTDEHNFRRHPNIGIICEECLDDSWEQCTTCGEWRNPEDRIECNCADRVIFNYNFTPHNFTYYTGDLEKKTDDKLFLGFEIEVEAKDAARETGARVVSEKDFLYCMRDGSLDHGFEFASHPITFRWLQENFGQIGKVFAWLRDNGFKSYETNTCGMHLHLSENAFSNLHLYKFLKLIYDFPYLTKIVSERSDDRLAQWAGIEKEGGGDCVLDKARSKRNQVGDRHVAVNLNGGDTIELRIFRGTIDDDRFLKNIEFAVAAYNFTHKIGHKDVNEHTFVDWVCKNKKQYPNLYNFMGKEGLV